MSDNLKSKTICVVDNGLFVSFARMLSKGFKKTYYYTPWQSSFPRTQQLLVGDGFNDIERIKFPLDKADEIDLWVFLDLYHSDLQCYLEEHGARVWGARKGEELELYRWEFKEYLKRIGLPVQPMEHVIGFQKLRERLKAVKNKYVKTSFVRGDFETFRHDSYQLSEPRIDELEHTLGPAKVNYEFIVEDEIPEAVEVGYDGFTIDGQWPSHAMCAIEIKDCGMIGSALPYGKLPEPVRHVNSKLSDALQRYRYRGFLSTEIRYTKEKKPYFIDPCCRLGTPSNELLQELFSDWPQVVWDGATGKVTSPKIKNNFAVMAVVHSEWAVNDWQALHYPKELDEFIKLRFHTRINEKNYVAPQPVGLPDLGGVVGAGPTLLAAIKQCKERASQIKGYQVKCDLESIDKALEQIQLGEKYGVHFVDGPLPTLAQLKGS